MRVRGMDCEVVAVLLISEGNGNAVSGSDSELEVEFRGLRYAGVYASIL